MDKIELIQQIGEDICEGCGPYRDCGLEVENCMRVNNAVDLLDKWMAQQKYSAYHHNKCNTCGKPMSGDCPNCQRLWES